MVDTGVVMVEKENGRVKADGAEKEGGVVKESGDLTV